MRLSLLFISVVFAGSSAYAQISKTEIKNNPLLAASNYYAYPGPKSSLTPSPKGYKPFYISHYGRHGSRYLIGTRDYNKPLRVLQVADSLDMLTLKGKDLLKKVVVICNEAAGRDGELTALGAAQHKGIAERMYRNFPEVFDGQTNIDAKSTIVIRCILSMENALQQFLILNPKLSIRHDASYHDMYYMNQNDKKLSALKRSDDVKKAYDAFSAKYEHYDRLMNSIFRNESYWKENVNAKELNNSLFKLAGNMQSTDLRDSISLFDLFTSDEIYNNWLQNNAWWYINYGPSPLCNGRIPYSQRNLLRKIISEADSCIALKHPGATLRYGHDTMVMPLSCLLDLDGLGKQISDLDSLDDANWCNYNIFPMGCNIQFVFYRKGDNDKDVIFKVLRNENEATLPLKTDMFPYYHWSDFKSYFLKKLDSYDSSYQ